MYKILLVSTPFNSMRFPPLHTASLKSYLNSQKIPTDAGLFYLYGIRYLGLRFYNFLRNFKFGDLIYAYLLFPEQKEDIQKAFIDKLQAYHPDKDFVESFNFHNVLEKVQQFHKEIFEQTPWENYDLVGFYCYQQQFLPSLYVSKCIKAKCPRMRIVFAGSGCSWDLGKGILATFPYVDFTISGEGEETLAELYYAMQGKLDYAKVKSLTYREGKKIKVNPPRKEMMDLDKLPYPDYDDFFLTLDSWPEKLRREYSNDYYLLVEVSRGCWWRRCSFCTLNEPHGVFREKSATRVVHEVSYLIEKHHTLQILLEQRIQPNKWLEMVKALYAVHPGMKGFLDMCFSIRGMTRSDYRKLNQYRLAILVGIESLCTRHLKKMNKGVTAIQNIEALKFCEEYNVICAYSILQGYPNEDVDDFEDNAKAIKYILHLPPPFDMETLRLSYNSMIFKNPKKYGIKAIVFRQEEKIRYPPSILKTFKPFFYDFIPEKPRKHTEEDWKELIRHWRNTYYKPLQEMHLKLHPLLFFQESKKFINIVDERGQYLRKHTLFGREKELYLFCDRIRTKKEIYAKFPDFPKNKIEDFTTRMDHLKLMFIEDQKALSLAVRYNQYGRSSASNGN
ncbi:MAG: RiPP maturation radical SAM C-methyltransferase [Methanosarcinaceae archaeon]